MSRRIERTRELSVESSESDLSSATSSYHPARYVDTTPRQNPRRLRHGRLMHQIKEMHHLRKPSTKKLQRQKNQSKSRKPDTDAEISTFHSFCDIGLKNWINHPYSQSNLNRKKHSQSLVNPRDIRPYTKDSTAAQKTTRMQQQSSSLDSGTVISNQSKIRDSRQPFYCDTDLDSMSSTRVSDVFGDKCCVCAQHGLRTKPIPNTSNHSSSGSQFSEYLSSFIISDNLPYFRCIHCDRTFHGDCLEYALGLYHLSGTYISNDTPDLTRCPECYLFRGEIDKVVCKRSLLQSVEESMVKWKCDTTTEWMPQSCIKGKLKVAARSSEISKSDGAPCQFIYTKPDLEYDSRLPYSLLTSDVFAHASKSQPDPHNVEIMIIPNRSKTCKKSVEFKQKQAQETFCTHEDMADRLITYPRSKNNSWVTLPSFTSNPRASSSKVYHCWLCQDLCQGLYHSHQHSECPLSREIDIVIRRRMQISCPEQRKVIEKLLRTQCINLNFERIVLDCSNSDAELVACISQWSMQPNQVLKKTLYNMDLFTNDWVAKDSR